MSSRTKMTAGLLFAASAIVAGCSSPTVVQPVTATVTASVAQEPPQRVTVTVTASQPTTPVMTTGDALTAPLSAGPATPTNASAVKVGAQVPFTDHKGDAGVATLHSAEWVTTNELGDSPKHGAYLLLDVSVKATKGEPTGTNPFDWEVKDADGRGYQQTVSGFEPRLQASGIEPGETARGYVLYDLPKGPVTVRLIDFDGAVAAWAVK